MTIETSEGIFDSHQSFAQAAEQKRAKVDIPDLVIDLLEPHVFAYASDRNEIRDRLIFSNSDVDSMSNAAVLRYGLTNRTDARDPAARHKVNTA